MTNQALIVLAALAVAFAGFCVWLTVRIVNRRERWAKRTAFCLSAVVIVGLVIGYPLSFPWANAFLINHPELQWRLTNRMVTFYTPLGFVVTRCPNKLREMYADYRDWCMAVASVPPEYRGLH